MLISEQRTRQNDLSGSEVALKRSCEAFDHLENATQVDLASCLLNLGKLQRSMHLYADSERNLVKAINIIEGAYDEDSPFLRPYLIALIELYKNLRQKNHAKELQKRLGAVGTCPICETPLLTY